MAEEARERDAALSAETVDTAGEDPEDAGFTFVRSGRIAFAKITAPIVVDDGDPPWFTFGLTDPDVSTDNIEDVCEEMRARCIEEVISLATEFQAAMEKARA